MRVSKEWIEKMEASGVTWGLFFTITSATFVNFVLTQAEQRQMGRNRVTCLSAAAKATWTVRSVRFKKDEIEFTHYEHVIPRPANKVYLFARVLPDFMPYSCPADGFLNQPSSWKRFLELMDHINPKGLYACQLLLGENGLGGHAMNVGFEDENDAILFKVLTQKNLTNTP